MLRHPVVHVLISENGPRRNVWDVSDSEDEYRLDTKLISELIYKYLASVL
jgi:hypothetical protein